MRPALLIAACLLAGGCETPDDAGTAAPSENGLATIARIQGSGPRSPLEGQTVTVEAVVAGKFNGLGGVFLQSERDDGDPATAEGLFLPRDSRAEPRLAVGHRVRVTGAVRELGEDGVTLTTLEASDVKVLSKGRERTPVPALELSSPPASAADWERYEGMRLRISGLGITGHHALMQYGELLASFGGTLANPTEFSAPVPGDRTIADQNARRRLVLDDGRTTRNPERLWFLPALPNDAAPLRIGSRLGPVEGVLDQRFGDYRLQLVAPLEIVEQAPRPPAPQVSGDRRVAGFNVLNLFNGNGHGGGFPTGRGAASLAEYRRQQAKLVAVVQALNPDLAALMELENDGYGPKSSIAQFVAALNAAGPHRDWRFVDAGEGPGDNPIRVGLIYRAGRFSPVGPAVTLTEGPFADRSRAPLVQAFRAGKGPVFVVAANHFKSKGGCDDAGQGDTDAGDGQACFNATRVASARRLHEWLATDPTGTAPIGHLLIGDLNAHTQEDPLRLLRELGWRDALPVGVAPRVPGEGQAPGREQPHTYVYDGQAGRLDHALLDTGLAPRLRQAEVWHNSADELELFDYRRDRDDDAWRASDHDPILLGLDLADGGI